MNNVKNLLIFLLVSFSFVCFFVLNVSALKMECSLVGSKIHCTFPDEITEKLQTIWDKAQEIYKKVRFELKLFGTEYTAGEDGKVFVQLLEDNKPVENGVCQAKVYYPNNMPYYSAGLNYLGEKGIYYLDLTIPSELGVYMIAVECWKPYEEKSFYSYFNRIGTENTMTNSSLLDVTKEEKIALKENVSSCIADEWMDRVIDFPRYHYIYNISELYGYFHLDKATLNLNLRFEFYRWNDLTNEKFYINGSEINTTVNETLLRYDFPSVVLNQPFGEDERLLATLCSYSITELPAKPPALLFDYGSISYNSSFKRTTKAVNVALATEIRGGGEIHVSSLYPKIRNFIVSYLGTEITNSTCIDNTTLRQYREETIEIEERGKIEVLNVTKHQDIHCDYGCDFDRNVCLEPVYIRYLWIFGGIIIIVIVVLLILKLSGRI